MSTNFLIGFPDIPANALNYTPTATTYPYDYTNTIRGPRYTFARFSAGTAFEIVYDLGAGFASLDSQAQFLILTRADLLQSQGATTVKLQSDTTSAFGAATNHVNDASFATQTLYGPYSEDTFYTFTLSSQRQWWRVQFVTGGSVALRVGKIYFGQWFDMGKDPHSPVEIEKFYPYDARHSWTSGTQDQERVYRSLYRFKITWEGVTDAKVQSFNVKVNRYKHINSLYLYTDTVHTLLNSYRLVNVKISDVTVVSRADKPDFNTVTATFEELPTT